MKPAILAMATLFVMPVSSRAFADASAGPGCFAMAAQRYGLDETLLRAIAKVESNYAAGAVHFDADGTHDVGVMQINSSHFAELRQRFGLDEQALLEHPCTNVFVGASILAGFVSRFGTTWRAVGSYGAGTAPAKEAARIAYATSVGRAFARLTASPKPPGSAHAFAAPVPDAPAGPRMLVLE